jgi:hypothetical protein
MITPARHSNSRYIAADADDPTAYGPDGLLKDGYKIRVPVELMDSALPLQRMATVPRSIRTGLEGEHRLDKYFFPDGSQKPARTPRTRNQPVVDVDQFSDHKPGFRGADAARGVADAGRALQDAAYEAMVRDNERAWMPEHMRAADTRVTTDAARPLGISDSEWARAEGIRQMCDAWKADAPAVQDLPAGRFPLSAGEGNPCTIDGDAGTLQREGGYLVCRARPPIGPTRSGASSGDGMSAADAQAVKDRAWREMVDDVSNAWRSPA